MRAVLTVGSLFSGIGGFDLGFELAGFKTVWQVEIDSHAQSVLRHRWSGVSLYADIRGVGWHNLTPVDIITFGSPCQDLSVAGKRAGMAGERSGLFFEAIRIIRELRPTWAIWENVPGALSSTGGRDFGAALDALADCGAVDICWRVLDAQYFGVAQRRRRVFVVADFRGERAGEVLFEPEGVRGDSAAGRAPGQDVAGTLGGGAGSRGDGSRGDGSDSLVPCVFHATQDPISGSISPALPTNKGSIAVATFDPVNITSATNRTRVEDGLPANTLHSQGLSAAVGTAVRRLTPRECERLQGFPDDWTRWDVAGNEIADSHRYRMLGNAVCVPVARWIAERIRDAPG